MSEQKHDGYKDSYNDGMSRHSVAEAKNHLPELIARAMRGEDIVITKYGEPVISLQPLRPAPGPIMPKDMEWLDQIRIRRAKKSLDSGRLLEKMRDEEWN